MDCGNVPLSPHLHQKTDLAELFSKLGLGKYTDLFQQQEVIYDKRNVTYYHFLVDIRSLMEVLRFKIQDYTASNRNKNNSTLRLFFPIFIEDNNCLFYNAGTSNTYQ